MQTTKRRLICLAALFLATRVLAQDPVPLYPDNYKVLLENDRVRVLEFILRKGATEKFHRHPAAVTYVLSPFKIRFTFPDGTTKIREAKAGDVLFGEEMTHSPLNIGDTDARGILVEMKTLPKGKEVASANDPDLLTALTYIRGPAVSEEDLKRELLSTTAPTRAEAGNLQYDLYQSPNDKGSFLRFEVWRNAAALEEHKQMPPSRASFERRKSKGWTTDITTWKRVVDAVK
jgi:quinol monooxygenase YgiN/quercetin dioxygenase-like cupin family protein